MTASTCNEKAREHGDNRVDNHDDTCRKADVICISWAAKEKLLAKAKAGELDASDSEAVAACLEVLLSMREAWKTNPPRKQSDTNEGVQKPERKSSPRRSKGAGRRGRNSSDDYPNADREDVPIEDCSRGDRCQACGKGNLYDYPAAEDPFIEGAPPLKATIYVKQRLRCSGCGRVRTAADPPHVNGRKYAPSAQAMIILLKYGAALPFYRLGKCQRWLGHPVSPSVQWQLVDEAADLLFPIYKALNKVGANSRAFCIDDASFKVLSLLKENKTLVGKARYGMRTSAIVATTGKREICLYYTGRAHAGENLAALLDARDEERETPIQMSDGLVSNFTSKDKIISVLCNAHGFRKFADISVSFPEACEFILVRLGKVYLHDEEAKKLDLDDEARLAYHKEHSGPLMKEIKAYMEQALKKREVEDNSGLGKAYGYMLGHWEQLTRFLEIAGVPLDNNTCERAIKCMVMMRKNCLFFKTEHGAFVGSMMMSILETAIRAKTNPHAYITAVLENATAVKANPAAWLPWNWETALAGMARKEELAEAV